MKFYGLVMLVFKWKLSARWASIPLGDMMKFFLEVSANFFSPCIDPDPPPPTWCMWYRPVISVFTQPHSAKGILPGFYYPIFKGLSNTNFYTPIILLLFSEYPSPAAMLRKYHVSKTWYSKSLYALHLRRIMIISGLTWTISNFQSSKWLARA